MLSSSGLWAQTTVRGTILSAQDGAPVPYALVTDPGHRFGTYADTNGRFTARVPAGIDTLLLSCVGFRDTLALISREGTEPVIKLRPQATQLAEVVVRSRKPRLLSLGALRRKLSYVWGNCSGRNIEFAMLIRNPKGVNGYLDKVAYLIDREGKPTAPFRVRIYPYTEGEPGPDLLPRSVIASARRGGTWCEVDLTAFNIPFPKEGLIVAMEWLPTDNPQHRFSKSYKMPDGQRNQWECYGHYLAFSKELKNPLVWERINGGYWRRRNAAFSRVSVDHPIIRVKVSAMN